MARTALVEARLKKHWSQEEAAEVIGIDHNTLYRWEAGKSTPRGYNLRQLCEVYGLSAAELGFEQNRPVKNEGKEAADVSRELLDALEAQSDDASNPGAWIVRSAASLGPLLDDQWPSDALTEALQIILPLVKALPTTIWRDLLRAGMATAIADKLPLTTRKRITAEERMQLCKTFEKSLTAGWQFFTQARPPQILAVSQSQLLLLQQMHTLLPARDRSAFCSSIYNLMGLGFCLQEQHRQALNAHENAYIAALSSGNAMEVTSSLLCQANSHQALGESRKAIDALEQIARTLSTLDGQRYILTQAHLLGVWADCAMTIGELRTARKKLDEIAELLDDITPNEEFDRSCWYELTAKYSYSTGNYSIAAQQYEQALQGTPIEWVVRRIRVLSSLISTYTILQDRDRSLATLEKVGQTGGVLNAPSLIRKPLKEALQGLLIVFPYETTVKAAVSNLVQQMS